MSEKVVLKANSLTSEEFNEVLEIVSKLDDYCVSTETMSIIFPPKSTVPSGKSKSDFEEFKESLWKSLSQFNKKVSIY